MINHYRMFAAYNAWANRLLYDAAATITEEELHSDKGAFFGSLFGTMSHLLTADRVWMNRFTGRGPKPKALDERPCPDLPSLTAARTAEDQRIIDWLDGLTDEILEREFSYSPITNPTIVSHRLGAAVAHFFNHQTHHRGQCHMILTALGKPSLALDMIYFVRGDGKEWL